MGNKINKAWHLENKMPQKPTFEQRVNWHLEHNKVCCCRPIPKKLLEEMIQKGIKPE